MSLGRFLGKVLTAPIKIVAMPLLIIRDVAESKPTENLIDTVTGSIEEQVKEIFDGKE